MFRKTIVKFHIKLQLNCRFVSAYGRLKLIVCSHEKSKRKDGLESGKEQEQEKKGLECTRFHTPSFRNMLVFLCVCEYVTVNIKES